MAENHTLVKVVNAMCWGGYNPLCMILGLGGCGTASSSKEPEDTSPSNGWFSKQDTTAPIWNPVAPDTFSDGDSTENSFETKNIDTFTSPDTLKDAPDAGCTGQIVTYYVDDDEDGYGKDGSGQGYCTSDPNFSAEKKSTNKNDCDDGNKDINPLTKWYLDADKDGHAAVNSAPVTNCENPDPASYTMEEIPMDDCDDTSLNVFPGNPVGEICSDNLDNDCDGAVDRSLGLYCLSSADIIFDAEGEHRLGNGVVGDVDNDGKPDLVLSAYQEGYYGMGLRGAIYVFYGKNWDFLNLDSNVINVSKADVKITGEEGEGSGDQIGSLLGYSLIIGDVNYDGYDDIVAGAYGDGASKGACYIIFGSKNMVGEYSVSGDGQENNGQIKVKKFIGEDKANPAYFGNAAGNSVAFVSDVSGDGKPEILIGAPNNSAGGKYSGAIYLVNSQSWIQGGNLDLSDVELSKVGSSTPGTIIVGEKDGAGIGQWVSSGDFDGNGVPELYTGSDHHDLGTANEEQGVAYVVYTNKIPGSGIFYLNAEIDDILNGFRLTGENPYDYAGIPVLSAETSSSDLGNILMIGARGKDDQSGSVYVYSSENGIPVSGTLSSADYVLNGSSGDYSGGCTVVGKLFQSSDALSMFICAPNAGFEVWDNNTDSIASKSNVGLAYFISDIEGVLVSPKEKKLKEVANLKFVGEDENDNAGSPIYITDNIGTADINQESAVILSAGNYKNGAGRIYTVFSSGLQAYIQ